MIYNLSNLDVYFHMANHYKKIRNAKSVIDCSIPKGYNDQCRLFRYQQCTMPRLTCPTTPRSCMKPCGSCSPDNRPRCSKFDSGRSSSAPPRRRLTYEVGIPDKRYSHISPGRPRSVNLEPTVKKIPLRTYIDQHNTSRNNTKNKKKVNKAKKPSATKIDISKDDLIKLLPEPSYPDERKKLQPDKPDKEVAEVEEPDEKYQTAKSEEVPRRSESSEQTNKFVDSVEDHEYVHFLLRITEDILRNNMYTNSGMDQVFDSHIEANRGRLNEDKMREQIDRLKQELNYPLTNKQQLVESGCECVELPKFLEECRCCPADNAELEKLEKLLCACTNPICPSGHSKTLLETDNAKTEPPKEEVVVDDVNNKAESSPPEVTDTENIKDVKDDASGDVIENLSSSSSCKVPESICECPGTDDIKSELKTDSEQQEILVVPKEIDETEQKRKSSDSELCKQNFDECIDPLTCTTNPVNQKVASPKVCSEKDSKVGTSIGSKLNSTFRVIHKDNNVERKLSQVAFYNYEVGDVCHCTITLRKTALKIESDEDNDQEYILVEGPVCMPKTMLKEKTIPVMIENLSSILNDSDFDIHSEAEVTESSKVNLLVSENALKQRTSESALGSISGHIFNAGEKPDYDLTPERDSSKRKEEEIGGKSRSSLKDDGGRRSQRNESTVNFLQSSVSSAGKNQDAGSQTGTGASFDNKQVDQVVGDGDSKKSEDSAPSHHRDSDAGSKYHYLLKDASTSVTSFELRQTYKLRPVVTVPPALKRRSGGSSTESERSLSNKSGTQLKENVLAVEEKPLPARSGSLEENALPIEQKSLHIKSGSSLTETVLPIEQYRSAPQPPELYSVQSNASGPPIRANPSAKKVMPNIFEYATVQPQEQGSEATGEIQSVISSSRRPYWVSEDAAPQNDEEEEQPHAETRKVHELDDLQSDDEVILHRKSPQEIIEPVYDDEDYDHKDIISKLDEVPEPDHLDRHINNANVVADKLREFRKIEPKDANRRFQSYVNTDNFEIRRRSTDSERREFQAANSPKKEKRSSCC